MRTVLLAALSTYANVGIMSKGKLKIEWRRGLIPLSLLVMFFLTFHFHAPLWVLAVFVLWIPIYYVGYPWYLRRKWMEYEKEFAVRFQKRDFRGLVEHYKKQWFLRKFGPKAEMLGKLALIYTGMEKHREAEQVLEQAVDLTPPVFRDRLYYNLANIKYELGKYDEAAHMYKALKKGSPYGRSVRIQLAFIDLHRGKKVEIARAILKKELGSARGTVKLRIEEALGKRSS